MRYLKLSSKAVLFILCFYVFTVNAQNNKEILLKSGNYTLESNIDKIIANSNPYTQSELVNGNYYRIIQFKTIPNQIQKKILKNSGVTLLNYIPKNAFFALLSTSADLNSLKTNGALGVFPIDKKYKLTTALLNKNYPDWAMYGENMIELNAIYYSNISEKTILDKLNRLGLEVTMSNDAQTVRFRIKISELDQIYNEPAFYYFEEIDSPPVAEGTEDRTSHRSNSIATDYLGGLKYDGTGMTVMLQDNSIIDSHIDFTGRVTNDGSASQSGDHGEHTGGIIAAAGNLDPKGRGMAFGTDLLVYGSSDNNFNDVPTLYTTDDLTITSKSYGNGNNAGYTALARQLDQQVRNMPSLIHVFSAGNSGTSDFGYGAGSGWGNITGGHKQGKNVLAVGNLSITDGLAGSSSRGPAADGRIKPDICAVGTSVYSTLEPNNYQNMSGTSMACPGVAGTMAQLYHAYKSMNGGVNPNSALMKASVLNTAEDLGNVGPDFKYGWGRINARRAYELLNANNYLSATITQGGNNSHTINVPAGVSQLRVMVYWSDYEASANASPALVNDINMQVVDPSVTSFNPWVLDETPNATALNSLAVRGIDALNNVEQVTIDNPASGNYSVNVSGFAIPQGPQEYFVVYEFVMDEVVLTYPIGGEGFAPGTTETIRWDSYGVTGNFNLEYSTDNGGSWTPIVSNYPFVLRYYNWNVPAVLSGQAKVRVTRGALSDESDDVFSIIGTPTNLTVDWACPDSMQMSWSSVSGATGYEVSMLGSKYMDSVGVSSTTSYVFYGVPANNSYWLSVRSLGPNFAQGERAIAIEKTPGTFACPINIDASLTNLGPLNNSTFLACIANNLDVDITITNEGVNSISNVPVHYTLNGGAAVNEIYSPSIAPGASVTYTFTSQISPISGLNTLVVWNSLTGDGNNLNDSVVSQFNFNTSAAKNIPWSDNFETFITCNTTSNCEVEVCNLNNDFINEANGVVDDIDWRTDINGTPSTGTGPSTDFNPGTVVGKYIYLEASGSPVCSNKQANLLSPCLDLTNIQNPLLTFAYHMEGADIGSLHVDILVNGVWTNDIMTAISGNQGSNWLTQNVSLNAYIGNIINLRFRGITGNDYESDIALDDINVSGTVGLDENLLFTEFNIHPNPSNGLFNFVYNGEELLTVKVVDVNGKLLFEKEINTMENGVIDLTGYANGFYMLILNTEKNIITKKLSKTN
jgi:subtilisin family serine protease